LFGGSDELFRQNDIHFGGKFISTDLAAASQSFKIWAFSLGDYWHITSPRKSNLPPLWN